MYVTWKYFWIKLKFSNLLKWNKIVFHFKLLFLLNRKYLAAFMKKTQTYYGFFLVELFIIYNVKRGFFFNIRWWNALYIMDINKLCNPKANKNSTYTHIGKLNASINCRKNELKFYCKFCSLRSPPHSLTTHTRELSLTLMQHFGLNRHHNFASSKFYILAMHCARFCARDICSHIYVCRKLIAFACTLHTNSD